MTFLSLHLQCRGCRRACDYLQTFTCALGIWTQVFTLAQQTCLPTVPPPLPHRDREFWMYIRGLIKIDIAFSKTLRSFINDSNDNLLVVNSNRLLLNTYRVKSYRYRRQVLFRTSILWTPTNSCLGIPTDVSHSGPRFSSAPHPSLPLLDEMS